MWRTQRVWPCCRSSLLSVGGRAGPATCVRVPDPSDGRASPSSYHTRLAEESKPPWTSSPMRRPGIADLAAEEVGQAERRARPTPAAGSRVIDVLVL